MSVDTVRKWRNRYVAGWLAGLRDAPRPRRPRRLPDAIRAQVIALACELPTTSGVPLSRWSSTGPPVTTAGWRLMAGTAPMGEIDRDHRSEVLERDQGLQTPFSNEWDGDAPGFGIGTDPGLTNRSQAAGRWDLRLLGTPAVRTF